MVFLSCSLFVCNHGGDDQTRTDYLYVANVPLYRVSYIPIGFMVVIQFFGDDQGLRLRRKVLRTRTDYLYVANVPFLAGELHPHITGYSIFMEMIRACSCAAKLFEHELTTCTP